MDRATFLHRLGQKVRAVRQDRRLSQERLAQLAGLSPRYVSQLESGRGNISILRLHETAKALDIPVHELVRLEEPTHAVIALVGLRGAGKSTVGPRLAETVGSGFVELDALIEEAAGLGLDEIFALHGEAYYRRLERDVLEQFIRSRQAAVLATGGGIVTERPTYELLKENTRTVWLKARPEQHLERVAAQGDRRPMAGRAAPLDELRSLLREREVLYAEAAVTIDTSALSPEAVTREVAKRLGVG